MTDRKQPGVAFCATLVVVAVLVVYPMSLGPACWLVRRDAISMHWVAAIYWPLVVAGTAGPRFVRQILISYSDAFAPPSEVRIIIHATWAPPSTFETKHILQDLRDAANYWGVCFDPACVTILDLPP